MKWTTESRTVNARSDVKGDQLGLPGGIAQYAAPWRMPLFKFLQMHNCAVAHSLQTVTNA
jgi:hypothetical protein